MQCAGEEWCPVTSTATVLGRKRHPVVGHRLLQDGPSGFNDLTESVDGSSSKVLSDSLDDLAEQGPVDRRIVSEEPFRVRYSLTARGRCSRSSGPCGRGARRTWRPRVAAGARGRSLAGPRHKTYPPQSRLTRQ